MITGIHIIAYAAQAEKTCAFFRDVLGLSSVDAGDGWLIFALPPAEFAAHPTEEGDDAPPDGQPRCELYLMCDDLPRTMAELKGKGVRFTMPVSEQPWGSLTMFALPGAGQMGLYQPKHPVAIKPAGK